MDERGSLAVYGRLMEQTLANARAIGVNAALTGPIARAMPVPSRPISPRSSALLRTPWSFIWRPPEGS